MIRNKRQNARQRGNEVSRQQGIEASRHQEYYTQLHASLPFAAVSF